MMKSLSAMASLLGVAASAMQGIGNAAEENNLQARAMRRLMRREAGDKLRTQRGTIGLGMHRVNKHGPINGVTVSPKKDIGKGPAKTLPVRGYSTNRQRLKFEKAVRHNFKTNARKGI